MYIIKGGKRRICVLANCKACGSEFHAEVREIKRGNGKFCSQQCSRSHQAKLNAKAMRSPLTHKEMMERWKRRTPIEVHKAHDAVEIALANGTLVRQPCEVCGATRVDAHHDDYAKPLDIRWLCRSHHLLHHRSK